MKLNHDDKVAIDLILNQTQMHTQTRRSTPMPSAPAAVPHVTAVQKLLSLLGSMPAPEPAADLVARTLDLIDRSPMGMASHPVAAAVATQRAH
ncbi:MAG: hypothetical protein JO353_00480 [Phycisphaerae bacterium]|nr:hypothetical protein [Phycisphaerae bacterium]